MVPSRLARACLVLLAALLGGGALAAQTASAVSGVVVDSESGAPVPDVFVSVRDSAFTTFTDREGRFRLEGVPVGSHRLVLRHLAYGEHGRPVTVSPDGALELRVRISRQAIELSPLEVDVLSEAERARVASGTASRAVERSAVDVAERRGMKLIDLLRQGVPGIRYRNLNGFTCLEYRFQGFGETCRDMAVVVDGVAVQQVGALLESMDLSEIERMQVLSEVEAGARYGGLSGQGVLEIETRTAALATALVARPTVTGFTWAEPRPYPLLRVLGVSFGGNAAAVGLLYLTVDKCREDRWRQMGAGPCNAMAATGAGFLTGTVGSLLTGWAGRTARTEGRTVPRLVVGAATSMTGYLLALKGQNAGSDALRGAGIAVLGVGTPVLLTLTDRVFRVRR